MIQKDTTEPGKTYSLWVCPSCGKTTHLSRKYCDCHADLCHASGKTDSKLPEVGPYNFEVPGLHCGDCPEACMYCASFGESQMNSAGFGSKDCRHKTIVTAQCYCCQSQIKLAAEFTAVNFMELIGEILAQRRAKAAEDKNQGETEEEEETEEEKNVFFKAADFIRDAMAKPVLDRIRQAEDWTG
jgi:hypothetical protein